MSLRRNGEASKLDDYVQKCQSNCREFQESRIVEELDAARDPEIKYLGCRPDHSHKKIKTKIKKASSLSA